VLLLFEQGKNKQKKRIADLKRLLLSLEGDEIDSDSELTLLLSKL